MSAGRPPGVRYVVDVSASDVGARVVLRHRGDGTALHDVLGHVERWSDGVVAVRTRSGRIVEVAEADLVAAKRVPEPPPRR